MKPIHKKLRRRTKIIFGIIALLVIGFLIYFPGQQTPIALTLATGLGLSGLQARVDRMEGQAIKGKEFADSDKRFLKNLYSCFAKGARLTIVLRQSGQMMRRYLSKTGEDLKTSSRIFAKSEPVQDQMSALREQIMTDLRSSGGAHKSYSSAVFHMGDPKFFDSCAGLYLGRITAKPDVTKSGTVVLYWRAECPWEWPSYTSLFKEYGDYHAQCFPLPNAISLVLDPRYCLKIDDGLGGYLVTLGLAKPFLVWSEWTEEIDFSD